MPRPGKDGETNGEGFDDAFQGDAENRRNKENEVVKSNVGRRKWGRPSEKDKGLSVSKKAKNSPPTKKKLKMYRFAYLSALTKSGKIYLI